MEYALQKIKSLAKKNRMQFLVGLLVLFSFEVLSQNRIVIGKVSSPSEGPLPGVSVLVRGTTIGTVTDANGLYNISVPSNSDSLVFSFIGYASQSQFIGNRTTIDVNLAVEAKQLSEVVVTALGIQKEKARLGYAVQEVKGQDLVKAREPNPINSLTGKVAGLTVGPSAELLGAPNLFLRGKAPLYVIDGVPVNSDTWNISPDDIESYTVLKGPTASALYGSRGQYGAIQITTKRGSKDKRGFSVDFNSSMMLDNSFIAIPKVQDEYGPGDHGKYAFVDGKGSGVNDGDYDVWGPRFEGQLIPQYDSPVDPNTGVRSATPWVARGKDNLQRYIRNGILSSNNISVSSTGKNMI
jgi:TonB-dependent SusC/RagA subfamily outer membrane receptor